MKDADHRFGDGEHAGFALGNLINPANGLKLGGIIVFHAGILTNGLSLSHFELADQEGMWYPAEATIRGATVIVRNERLPHPAAVRYAYAINPQQFRLYNRDGLPASPFCSHPELLKCEP